MDIPVGWVEPEAKPTFPRETKISQPRGMVGFAPLNPPYGRSVYNTAALARRWALAVS